MTLRRGSKAEKAAETAERRETDRKVAGITADADDLRPPVPSLPPPDLTPGYARIVERVFDLPDPEALYERLEADLMLGHREHDSVREALDRAESNAQSAFRLFVNARVEHERFGLDAELVEAGLWQAATAELQAEKDAGQRSKAITDADVRHRCAALFPDEWREIQDRRARAKGMLDALGRLADLWQQRSASLRKLAD